MCTKRPNYGVMLRKLNILMIPPPFDESGFEVSSEEDWVRDSERSGVEGLLDFEGFLEAWFELADFWVDKIEIDRYIDFVQMCYEGATKWSEVDGEEDIRVFKDDADIFYNANFFGDESQKSEPDFFKGHTSGNGSLDDLPGLFAGEFNFRQVTPYSSNRCEDFILQIYEYRAQQMKARSEKFASVGFARSNSMIAAAAVRQGSADSSRRPASALKPITPRTTSSQGKRGVTPHAADALPTAFSPTNIKELPNFQESIVSFFSNRFSRKAKVILAELKAFIMGCFQFQQIRTQSFKYFFSEADYTRAHSQLGKKNADRSSSVAHYLKCMQVMFPDLRFKYHIEASAEKYGTCYVKKFDFLDSLRKAAAHVPLTSACSLNIMHELAGMLYYKDVNGDCFVPAESEEGRKLYKANQVARTKLISSFKQDSVRAGMEGSRADINALPDYIDFEVGLSKCMRLWDLEDDYLKISRVQTSLTFLQYWWRKHKKEQRRKARVLSETLEAKRRFTLKREKDRESMLRKKSSPERPTLKTNVVGAVATEEGPAQPTRKNSTFGAIGGRKLSSRGGFATKEVVVVSSRDVVKEVSVLKSLGGHTLSNQKQSQIDSPSTARDVDSREGGGKRESGSGGASRSKIGEKKFSPLALPSPSANDDQEGFLDLAGGTVAVRFPSPTLIAVQKNNFMQEEDAQREARMLREQQEAEEYARAEMERQRVEQQQKLQQEEDNAKMLKERAKRMEAMRVAEDKAGSLLKEQTRMREEAFSRQQEQDRLVEAVLSEGGTGMGSSSMDPLQKLYQQFSGAQEVKIDNKYAPRMAGTSYPGGFGDDDEEDLSRFDFVAVGTKTRKVGRGDGNHGGKMHSNNAKSMNYNSFDGAGMQFQAPVVKEKQPRMSPANYRVSAGGGTRPLNHPSGGSSSHFGESMGSNMGRAFSATNKAPGRPGTGATAYYSMASRVGGSGGGGALSRQMVAARPSTEQQRSKKFKNGMSPRKLKTQQQYYQRTMTADYGQNHKVLMDERVSDIHVSVVANAHYNNPLARANY
jgi:hypothetical protein